MTSTRWFRWVATSLTGASVLALGPVAAQSKPTSPTFAAAIDAWLSSDEQNPKLLSVATEQTLAGKKPALRHLAAVVRRTTAQPKLNLRIELLLRDVALGFHEQQRQSGMFFAGQYESLSVLQPYAGRIYLQLVTDTPDWFPDHLRASVIPALRDLLAPSPTRDQIEELREIASDEEFESDALRLELSYALAEWGDHSLIAPKLRELREAAGKRKSGDELYFVRRIALVHYNLRDYRKAGRVWIEYLRGMEAIDTKPPPADYYNAACSLSLSGLIREALSELDRCAGLLRSDEVDDSLRLERKLFDTDPELRAVRPTKRFQRIVKSTFEKESDR